MEPCSKPDLYNTESVPKIRKIRNSITGSICSNFDSIDSNCNLSQKSIKIKDKTFVFKEEVQLD